MQEKTKKVLIVTIFLLAVTLFFNNLTYAIENTKDTIKKVAVLKMPDSWDEVDNLDISGFLFELQFPDGGTDVYDCSQINFDIDTSNESKTIFDSDRLTAWLYTDNTMTFIFKDYETLSTSISKNDYRFYDYKNDSQTYSFTTDREIENQTLFDINKEYPSQYDLRNKTNIRVENQGGFGICWDFALTKALETTYNLKYDEDINLSEMYMDYMTSDLNGRGNRELHKGGKPYTYYNEAIRGGVCDEEQLPYTDDKEYQMSEVKNCKSVVLPQSAFLIDEIEICLNRNKEIITKMIKEQLMNNGAVSIAITFDQSDFNTDNNTFFLPTYCSQNNSVSHEVTIIGWDDSFSKEEFQRHAYISYNYVDDIEPREDGAWIVLNSWGEGYGDNGIFYLSYESDILNIFGFLDVVPYDENINEYTYVENEYKKYQEVKLNENHKKYFYQEFNVKGDNENITQITLANAIRGKLYYIDNYKNRDEINFDDKVFIGDFGVSDSPIPFNFMTWATSSNPLKTNFVFDNPIKINGDKFLIIVEIDGDYVSKAYLNKTGGTKTYYTDDQLSTNWSSCTGNLPIGVFTIAKEEPKPMPTPMPTPTPTLTPMPTQTPIPADESTITDEETKPEENTTNNLEDNPKTGDNILIWINLIATSVIGLTLTIKLTKKRENEEE